MIGTTKFYYTHAISGYPVISLEKAVFALSATEYGFNANALRVEGSALPIAQILRESDGGWTRTPNIDTRDEVIFVFSVDSIRSTRPDTGAGYFPCFTLPSTALVTEELELVEG